MKVILQQDVPNLGEAGDIVQVKRGYARNFLMPRNMVLVATASNQRQKKHQDRLIKFKKDKREKTARAMAEKFTNIVCDFKVRVGDVGKLYGSVTALDIAQNLYDQGYSLDKRKVQLAEPIKALGEYEVTVKLAQGIESQIKVRVMDLDGNLEIQTKSNKDQVESQDDYQGGYSEEANAEVDQDEKNFDQPIAENGDSQTSTEQKELVIEDVSE